MRRQPSRLAGALLPLSLFTVALLFVTLPAGPVPLSYDPEAWLVWGRELVAGRLDVTAGPAIKPLPMLVDAALIGAAGPEVGRALWAAIALAGWGACAALVAQLVREQDGRWPEAAAAGAVVLTVGALGGAALTGGSEGLVAALLLLAVRARSEGRHGVAAGWLAVAALLRPESLVLLAAHAVWPARPARLSQLAVAGVLGAAVCAAWGVLQLAGSGALTGAATAGAALRPGQPGVADVPVLASLGEALRVGALPLALLVVLWLSGGRSLRPAAPATRVAAAFALLWILTVAVMAQLGFSGEARYQAPGVLLLATAALLRLPRSQRSLRWSRAGLLVCGCAAAAVIGGAWAQARDLARAQQELDGLLSRPAAQQLVASCERVAVGQFLRPAVALRLGRAISSLQSPSLRGADCVLVDRAQDACDASSALSAGRWQLCRQHPDRHSRN